MNRYMVSIYEFSHVFENFIKHKPKNGYTLLFLKAKSHVTNIQDNQKLLNFT